MLRKSRFDGVNMIRPNACAVSRRRRSSLVTGDRRSPCVFDHCKTTNFSQVNFDLTANKRLRIGENLGKQETQLSQRDRAAGCVIVFGKSRRLELGDNILRTL